MPDTHTVSRPRAGMEKAQKNSGIFLQCSFSSLFLFGTSLCRQAKPHDRFSALFAGTDKCSPNRELHKVSELSPLELRNCSAPSTVCFPSVKGASPGSQGERQLYPTPLPKAQLPEPHLLPVFSLPCSKTTRMQPPSGLQAPSNSALSGRHSPLPSLRSKDRAARDPGVTSFNREKHRTPRSNSLRFTLLTGL